MQKARLASACLALSLCFAPGVSVGQRQSLGGIPTKIEVTGASYSAGRQPGIEARVQLLDPVNRPAKAKKDFEVEIAARTQNGAIETSKVVIKRGDTGATARLPVKGPGLVEVTASNPQLAEGGTIVDAGTVPVIERVSHVSPSPASSSAAVTPAPSSAALPKSSGAPTSPFAHSRFELREHSFTGGTSAAGGPRSELRLPSHAREGLSLPVPSMPSPDSPATSTTAAPVTASPTAEPNTATWKPVLQLSYTPKRPLRADENDPATIWALLGDPARTEMSIYVMSDLGPLRTEPIKIPTGERMGHGQLIADQPGAVQVWYDYSSPSATVPDPSLRITFTHPVWAPKIVPVAPRVGLFEPTEVAIELINSHDVSVPADTERQVNLFIGSGSGELSPAQVTFQPNQSRVATEFIPTWPGAVQLNARSPYLPEVSGQFTVTMPYVLLALCAAGSLTGALLAFWTEKPAASWQRIPIGLITGFVLYWGFLFGVVHVPNFPHAYVVNPFGAFILPLFGGWAGTKVIAFVAKQLGVQW